MKPKKVFKVFKSKSFFTAVGFALGITLALLVSADGLKNSSLQLFAHGFALFMGLALLGHAKFNKSAESSAFLVSSALL